MSLFSLPLLMGQPPAGAEGAPGGAGLMTFLPFVAIIAIFYFLIIRPQNKKRKETEKMLAALKKGDKIVTIGGIHGTIQSVKEHSVIVKIDENTKVEFSRSAISSIISASKEKAEKIEAGNEDDDSSSEDGKDD